MARISPTTSDQRLSCLRFGQCSSWAIWSKNSWAATTSCSWANIGSETMRTTRENRISQPRRPAGLSTPPKRSIVAISGPASTG